MTLDERCHILRTAVAHLNSVFVEDLMETGYFGEMLPDKVEELLADVRFDALTKRWCNHMILRPRFRFPLRPVVALAPLVPANCKVVACPLAWRASW